jgi:hypothetical protein
MAQVVTRRRKPRPIVDGYDHIEVASIDSFPASDPPGWIEAKAHPCAEDQPANGHLPGRGKGNRV